MAPATAPQQRQPLQTRPRTERAALEAWAVVLRATRPGSHARGWGREARSTFRDGGRPSWELRRSPCLFQGMLLEGPPGPEGPAVSVLFHFP